MVRMRQPTPDTVTNCANGWAQKARKHIGHSVMFLINNSVRINILTVTEREQERKRDEGRETERIETKQINKHRLIIIIYMEICF